MAGTAMAQPHAHQAQQVQQAEGKKVEVTKKRTSWWQGAVPGSKGGAQAAKQGALSRDAHRAAMLDQLHSLSIAARTASASGPRLGPLRPESATPLYASSRPSGPYFPTRPAAPDSTPSQPAASTFQPAASTFQHRVSGSGSSFTSGSSSFSSSRPAASFRSVSRLRGGVDPAAPPSMTPPLGKTRAEGSNEGEETVDSAGRKVAGRRSASRRPNPQAAPSPTLFSATPERRRTTPGRAAHRMSPSARGSAWARSIAAACNSAEPSPPASRRAARQ